MAQNPIVTITMENGDVMKAELYPEIAPISVNNFISLIKKGYYDGLIFHRVIRGFMIQGGCPEGTGIPSPTKLKNASVKIAVGMENITCVMIGPMIFGNTSLNIIKKEFLFPEPICIHPECR